jgi:hypothetical protein
MRAGPAHPARVRTQVADLKAKRPHPRRVRACELSALGGVLVQDIEDRVSQDIQDTFAACRQWG